MNICREKVFSRGIVFSNIVHQNCNIVQVYFSMICYNIIGSIIDVECYGEDLS